MQNYCHWTKNQLTTTNQCYGSFYEEIEPSPEPIISKKAVKEAIEDDAERKSKVIDGYRRPFSNIAFYPPMYSGTVTSGVRGVQKATSDSLNPFQSVCSRGNRKNKFDINKGYEYGQKSVKDKFGKISSTKHEVDLRPSYQRYSKPTSKSYSGDGLDQRDTYTWHTVAGTLVHVKREYLKS